MNTYKGIVRIECEKTGCNKVTSQDMTADCFYCLSATSTIIDLEGKVLASTNKFRGELDNTASTDQQTATQAQLKGKNKTDKNKEVINDGL